MYHGLFINSIDRKYGHVKVDYSRLLHMKTRNKSSHLENHE